MNRMLVVFAALLYSTNAYSQASPLPPPGAAKPAAEPSAYCRTGAAAVFSSAGDSEMAAVQQGCRRGDIIAISASSQGSVFAIGRLCDFGKAIVNTGGQVLCSLTGTRGVR